MRHTKPTTDETRKTAPERILESVGAITEALKINDPMERSRRALTGLATLRQVASDLGGQS